MTVTTSHNSNMTTLVVQQQQQQQQGLWQAPQGAAAGNVCQWCLRWSKTYLQTPSGTTWHSRRRRRSSSSKVSSSAGRLWNTQKPTG
jgi:hypothetical protein